MVDSQAVGEAIAEYKKIKEALVGRDPEWCLPKIDEKALESSPKLVQPEPSESCKSLTRGVISEPK
jgi:hypothetical protein